MTISVNLAISDAIRLRESFLVRLGGFTRQPGFSPSAAQKVRLRQPDGAVTNPLRPQPPRPDRPFRSWAWRALFAENPDAGTRRTDDPTRRIWLWRAGCSGSGRPSVV